MNIVNVKNILKTSGYQVQKVILLDMYFNCECTDIFLDWKTTKKEKKKKKTIEKSKYFRRKTLRIFK